MSESAATMAVAIIAPALGLVGMVLAAIIARNAQRESKMVTDLREDVTVLKEERAGAEARERLLTDYVHQLRDHISHGRGTPPPPWPDGLNT